jgi:nicotinamide-nucleotide amidase
MGSCRLDQTCVRTRRLWQNSGMRVEILCTGNELLDGSVVDTNSAWLEARLFALGLEVARKLVVPDDLGVIAAAMQEISGRADVCLTSGGLGPTPDDLTCEALALAAGKPLVEHGPTVERMKAWMLARGRTYAPAQARQAQVPEGARVLENAFGTAPHVHFDLGRCTFMLLPGVPKELFGLSEAFVLPEIAARLQREGTRRFHAFTQLRCYGVWEADMSWAVRELPQHHPHLRLGTRTSAPENFLKLRAEGATQEEADQRLASAVEAARARLGDKVYAVGEQTFAQATLAKLRAEGATVALAESLTGGLAASLLVEVPGASEVLVASYVVYAEQAKVKLLGLDPALIQREGVVSEPVAAELAIQARARAGTTYGAGVTGYAGPGGGTARDPVGTFYVSIATAQGVQVERSQFPVADRERIRRAAAFAVLDGLRRAGR